MTVMFTRIGTPHAGHQQDAMVYAKKRCEAVNQVYALHAQVYARFRACDDSVRPDKNA